jgi:hypothetical protein
VAQKILSKNLAVCKEKERNRLQLCRDAQMDKVLMKDIFFLSHMS